MSVWLEPAGGPDRKAVRRVARAVFKAETEVVMLCGSASDDRGRERLAPSSPDTTTVTV